MIAGRSHLKNFYHKAEQLGVGLPPLLVAAERVAFAVSQGVHGRRKLGRGDAFWQFREYDPGDPVASIDWRHSSRTDRIFVREKEWEAAQSVWLWGDHSASMEYSSSSEIPKKRGRADLIILALASLLGRAGERTALLSSRIKPATGRAALIRMGSALESRQTDLQTLPRFEYLPRYAHVVILSDFFSRASKIKQLVDLFASIGVKGHLLQVNDPAEETLPFSGRVEFEGFEGEEAVLTPRVEDIRQKYIKKLANHRLNVATICRRVGWTFDTYRTDQSPEKALIGLYCALGEIEKSR